MLPSRLRWHVRQPTVQECELVGRDVDYAEPEPSGEWGDYVVQTPECPEAQAKLAEALEAFGVCDSAHIVPAGVYLEE